MSPTRTLRPSADGALASRRGVDRHLQLVGPRTAAYDVRARIVRVQRETLDVSTLTLEPTSTWNGFRAGQHVQVGVEIDTVRHTQRFSIGSSDLAERLTGDRGITITVRGRDGGLASRHLARHAGVGTDVHLSQAEGHFVLPSLLPRRLLMISGGSGITPVMSMLRSLLDVRHEGPITFVHYARTPEETVFAAELDEIAEHTGVDLHVLHTRTGDKRLNELQLHGLCPGYADTTTFACGPAGMVQTLRTLYGDSDRLHVEVSGSGAGWGADRGRLRLAP